MLFTAQMRVFAVLFAHSKVGVFVWCVGVRCGTCVQCGVFGETA